MKNEKERILSRRLASPAITLMNEDEISAVHGGSSGPYQTPKHITGDVVDQGGLDFDA